MEYPKELIRESVKARQETATTIMKKTFLMYRIESNEGEPLGRMHYNFTEGRWVFLPGTQEILILTSEQLRDLHSLCQILKCFTAADAF